MTLASLKPCTSRPSERHGGNTWEARGNPIVQSRSSCCSRAQEADFERSAFDAFREDQAKQGIERIQPLTLPGHNHGNQKGAERIEIHLGLRTRGLQIVDPLWDLLQEEEFLRLDEASTFFPVPQRSP